MGIPKTENITVDPTTTFYKRFKHIHKDAEERREGRQQGS